jgi:REP-associated tyrosine transposase
LGLSFLVLGYCIVTVGPDTEMMAKYTRYQEQKERDSEKPRYKVEAFEATIATF